MEAMMERKQKQKLWWHTAPAYMPSKILGKIRTRGEWLYLRHIVATMGSEIFYLISAADFRLLFPDLPETDIRCVYPAGEKRDFIHEFPNFVSN